MRAPDGPEPGSAPSAAPADPSTTLERLLAGERIDLPDPSATARLAAALADRLEDGALLLLDGPLGAGKTTLVQGIAAALGSPAAVTSPTYTLIHEYPSPRGTIVHIDAYRLPGTDALQDLGLDDYLDRARLVVVEWGRPLAEAYPEAAILELARSDRGRSARLVGHGGTAPR